MLRKITLHQCASQTFRFRDIPGRANSSGESCLFVCLLAFSFLQVWVCGFWLPWSCGEAEGCDGGSCGWRYLHSGGQGADSERLEPSWDEIQRPKTQALFILTASWWDLEGPWRQVSGVSLKDDLAWVGWAGKAHPKMWTGVLNYRSRRKPLIVNATSCHDFSGNMDYTSRVIK